MDSDVTLARITLFLLWKKQLKNLRLQGKVSRGIAAVTLILSRPLAFISSQPPDGNTVAHSGNFLALTRRDTHHQRGACQDVSNPQSHRDGTWRLRECGSEGNEGEDGLLHYTA